MAIVDTKAVTPEMAAFLLEGNAKNRQAKPAHVEYLSKEMSAGRFKYNGDTIRVDRNGNLLDGQHRLMAVVKSGTTQMMTIVSGLDPEIFTTIDQGTRRTNADMLSVANPDLKNVGNLASAGRMLALMESRKMDGVKRGGQARVDEVLKSVRDNEKLLQEGLKYARRTQIRKLVPPAQSAAVYAHFSKENHSLTAEFFEDITSAMPTLPIASLLRNQLTDNKMGVKRMANDRLIHLYMKALRKHLDGQSVRQLKLTAGEGVSYANY